jgi:hypothetical protein
LVKVVPNDDTHLKDLNMTNVLLMTSELVQRAPLLNYRTDLLFSHAGHKEVVQWIVDDNVAGTSYRLRFEKRVSFFDILRIWEEGRKVIGKCLYIAYQ